MTEIIPFANRNFEEARALLTEARNYLAYSESAAVEVEVPAIRLQIGYETMRVTAQLLGTIARLLAIKAVRDGAITETESFGEDYAVADPRINLDPSSIEDAENPPKGLKTLLDRSTSLWERIERLEAAGRAKAA